MQTCRGAVRFVFFAKLFSGCDRSRIRNRHGQLRRSQARRAACPGLRPQGQVASRRRGRAHCTPRGAHQLPPALLHHQLLLRPRLHLLRARPRRRTLRDEDAQEEGRGLGLRQPRCSSGTRGSNFTPPDFARPCLEQDRHSGMRVLSMTTSM